MNTSFFVRVQGVALPLIRRMPRLWSIVASLCLPLLLVGTATAFTAIETESPNVLIEKLVLTPGGTPWAIVVVSGGNNQKEVRYLRYWDGATFRKPDCHDAHRLTPELPPPLVTSAMSLSSIRDPSGELDSKSRRESTLSSMLIVDRQRVFEEENISMIGNRSFVTFIGGGDRDAWAIMRSLFDNEKPLRLMKLGTSEVDICESVPTAKWAPVLSAPLHVTRDGRVIHWGPSFLAVRSTHGVWRRCAAVLPSSGSGSGRQASALVIERQESVWLFVSPMLYRVDAEGTVTGRLVPNTPVTDHNAVAHRWGDDRIVVWNGNYPPQVTCFNIDTLVSVPWPPFPSAWDVRGSPVFVKRDGTVWLTKYMDRTTVVALPPDADRPYEIPDVPFPHPHFGHGQGPTALECTDGTIFSGSDGVALIAPDHTVKRYGWRHGLAGLSTDVQETFDGRLWFLNSGRIVSFDPSREPQPLPGANCWEQLPPITDGPDGLRVVGTDHPARTGGYFLFPARGKGRSIYGGSVQRLFEGVALPVSLEGTPLVEEAIMRIDEDQSGRLLFLVASYIHPYAPEDGEFGLRFRYTPPSGWQRPHRCQPLVAGHSMCR